MGFHGGLMGSMVGFYRIESLWVSLGQSSSDLMVFKVFYWDINGMYPLVNVYISVEHHDFLANIIRRYPCYECSVAMFDYQRVSMMCFC